MKKRTLLSVLISCTIVLSLVQIVVSHSLSIVGVHLTRIDGEMEGLRASNEFLKHQIASASAITAIAEQAQSNGFSSAEYRYFELPPVAMRSDN
ncbi:MAG TPA: hypothetical protein VJL83_03160 [Patescibacteria group bacterium]|nr:hypothetical protein [Patescibacteria group bacterium]